MELAYQESAFTKPQLEKFDRAAVAKADITDLRMFTGCNYFLANESFNSYLTFYDYVQKPKPHGLATPRFIEELNDRYWRLAQGAFASNGCIFMFLWGLGIFLGGVYHYHVFCRTYYR